MTTLTQHSKNEFRSRSEIPSESEIKIGSLQRIAAATELMARSYRELVDRAERAEISADWLRVELDRANRRIAALKGVITKMRRDVK